MRLHALLETPLAGISHHVPSSPPSLIASSHRQAQVDVDGNPVHDQGSFSDADRELIKKFIVTKRYHEKLKKLPFPLYVYIIDAAGLDHLGRTYPEHELNAVEKSEKMVFGAASRGLTSRDFKTVFDEIEENQRRDPRGVHFIMGDNYSEEHQIGPTPWILVHRFMHCVLGEGDQVDGRPPHRELVKMDHPEVHFTFKSATSGKLINDYELLCEIATQYLITGEVPLKNPTPQISGVVKDIKTIVDRMPEELAGKIFYV